MVWGIMCYLGDAVAQMVCMTRMTGVAHSSREANINNCNWWARGCCWCALLSRLLGKFML